MRWTAGALAALALAAAATPARAFVRSEVPGSDGICLFWDRRDLSWVAARGDPPGLTVDDALPAFAASFRTWQDVACTDLVFAGGGEVDTRDVGFDEHGSNENLLVFRQRRCEDVARGDPCLDEGGCANRFDCWEFADSVIAVTTTTFSQKTGEIVDADIEFNASAFQFTVGDGPTCRPGETSKCVATDVENTATHEIGHFLGLDHSPVRGSTMYASAPEGETSKRTLAPDDVDGICAIYPAGQPPSVCVNRQDGSLRNPGPGCTCGAGGGVGLEGLLALLPLARWIRRRRPAGGLPAARAGP